MINSKKHGYKELKEVETPMNLSISKTWDSDGGKNVDVFWIVTPRNLVSGYQCSSETLETTYKITQHHNQEDCNLRY
jgi:hypothetical protein